MVLAAALAFTLHYAASGVHAAVIALMARRIRLNLDAASNRHPLLSGVVALRSSDVFRVLEQNDASIREELAAYIISERSDLADEVSESLIDLAA